ncbi:MAG TPA: class I SAM-dependent methyltransferase, partial [Polyangiaceae bacterium]|nr:class I SAM-dependent methyltransferase [Polyangiaceae bacterium]
MTSMAASRKESQNGSASQALSSFELAERERRKGRIERLNGIADYRAQEVHRYYAEQVQRLVRTLVTPGSKVLEVGCGLGDLLATCGAGSAIGIDISPRMIELAKQRHPDLDLRVADVERDPLPQGPFDAIILSDVIGLLEDIQVAFERLRSLLAPRGRIIVTYYNFLWEPIVKAAERLGHKTKWPDQ